MRLLLDTHALVWYTHVDPKLTTVARAVIEDATNEVWISPASYWEIAIKVHLGKWALNQPYPLFMDGVTNSTASRCCRSCRPTRPGSSDSPTTTATRSTSC